MKTRYKGIVAIGLIIIIAIPIGISLYFIIDSRDTDSGNSGDPSVEDPSFELPVHNLNEVSGIQVYHDNRSTKLHNGFDFQLENDTEIFSPIEGEVFQISKHQMDNDYWLIDVNIEINTNWTTFIAFEPWTREESVIDQQMSNISVEEGDIVKQNQSIGVLTPVVDSEFPHIHWSILEGGNYRSPYDYCSPKAKEDMEWLCDKFSKYPED